MNRKICMFFILLTLPLLPERTSSWEDEAMFMATVNPDVMIILDTSGSMTWDADGRSTRGDGSVNYPGRDTNGDGLANDSRMYQLKEGLRTVVLNIDFANIGLMRFHQKEDGEAYPTETDWYYSDDMICGGTDSIMVIDTIMWGHIGAGWRRCWNISENSLWWEWYYPDGFDSIWTVLDTSWEYLGLVSSKIHYDATGVCGNDGDILVHLGTPLDITKDSIFMWIDGVEDCPWDLSGEINKELRGTGSTPIARCLKTARIYYKNERIKEDIAIDTICGDVRKRFVLIATDGEETCLGHPVAEAEALRDIVIAGKHYEVKTYVLGIYMESGTQQLEDIAAAGGTEHAYYADSPKEVVDVLAEIFYNIREESFGFSGVSVTPVGAVSIGAQAHERKVFSARFLPGVAPIWKGHLYAYPYEMEGDVVVVDTSNAIWDAGDSLRLHSSSTRKLYTAKNGNIVAFDSTNIDSSDLYVSSSSKANEIISAMYGEGSGHLGDIFHSRVCLIRTPNRFYTDEGYGEFRMEMDTIRAWTVLAGANDGVLHCFSDSTGREVWGFIPPDLLPRIQNILETHTYYIDGPLQAADVWFPDSKLDSYKEKDEWKTVMMIGRGEEAGPFYTVIDLTDTALTSSDFLLNFTDTSYNMGNTTSEPLIHKMAIEIETDELRDRFFAFFGGGFLEDSLYTPGVDIPPGSYIYALDIYNAAKGYSPHYYEITDGGSYMKYPVAATPFVFDVDLNSYYDYLYIGDVAGQLWKLNIKDKNPASWNTTLKRLFVADSYGGSSPDTSQPIFSAPFVTEDKWYRRWIFTGTGDRAHLMEKINSQNRFYAFVDNDTLVTEGDLKKISPSGSFDLSDLSTYKGWYIVFTDYTDTPREGERLVTQPVVGIDTVYFATFQPESVGPCASGSGTGRIYKMHWLSGTFAGEIPSEVVGKGLPTVDLSVDMNGDIILTLSSSEGSIERRKVGKASPPLGKEILWWKEKR